MTEEERRQKWREKSRRRYWSDAEFRERKKAATATRGRERYWSDLPASRALSRERFAQRAETEGTKAERRRRDRERYLRIRDTPTYQARKRAEAIQRRATEGVSAGWQERQARSRDVQVARIREAQALTRRSATARYAPWTAADDLLVVRRDLTVLEIALRLGRTRSAVTTRRRDLKRMGEAR